jgi:hypothetical protein
VYPKSVILPIILSRKIPTRRPKNKGPARLRFNFTALPLCFSVLGAVRSLRTDAKFRDYLHRDWIRYAVVAAVPVAFAVGLWFFSVWVDECMTRFGGGVGYAG